jgi:3'-phosphoadenosine 5'-phosphosulfate (PAPS) 3'-phosphatase
VDDADLAAARRAAHDAAVVAMAMQRGIASRPKGDGSPVTDADLAADAAIAAVLAGHRGHDAVLSEEAADGPARLGARRLWIIDPIDGTREYAAGGSAWAVQIALVEDGRLVLGVLDMPALGCVLWGVPGQGAGIADAAGERALQAPSAAAPPVLVGSDSVRNRDHLARVRAALPEYACITSTSVGVKVERMLAGAASLYVHPRPIREWDAAAPAAVLAAAGGDATALDGRPLAWNTPAARCAGLLFALPGLPGGHPAMAARLAAAGLATAG